MDINIGDTVVIRGTVTGVNMTGVSIKTPGRIEGLYISRYRITEVIPKPKQPKVGEIWTSKHASTLRHKVYYVDDNCVIYENVVSGELHKKSLAYFHDQFKPEE